MLKKYLKEISIGFSAGLLNGLFGAGGGSVLVPLTEKFLSFDSHFAHANAIPAILIMSTVSAGIYLKNGCFDAKIWALAASGGLLGGFVGAKLLKKVPKKWLKIGFGAAIVWTSLKMIF